MMKREKPLSSQEINLRLKKLPEWKLDSSDSEGEVLVRIKNFPTYKKALAFVNKVGLAAEKNDHHPDIIMNYKKVTVRYWTHTVGGISALDFQMAAVVEKLVEKHS